MDFLNWSLLKNPLNWLTVTLMLAIYLFALHLVVTHTKVITTGGQG